MAVFKIHFTGINIIKKIKAWIFDGAKIMNKKGIITIVAIALLMVGWWYYKSQEKQKFGSHRRVDDPNLYLQSMLSDCVRNKSLA